ncbi:hypothetical protein T265_05639 [Opisthorchis viverrini]|uniref:RING-type domain-containing protein n=1 Tax=Opisthorchis viverrini TaxID=6198 RepID=A0A074ZNH0_OPIVI|nr:hypothetical protein T265_05639 [Opisthorchis viverrini]KER27317.1 hypothetical protein T265_05639 [Opisthorchis viverrini]
MGAKHPHLCLPVHFAVCDVVEKLLQELEQKVPDLSNRRKKKMRQYVYRRMRASIIPHELVQPENGNFSNDELDEQQLSVIRSLVYSIFIRGIRKWWNMKPCNRNASKFALTMSSNKDSQFQSSRGDNQIDGESSNVLLGNVESECQNRNYRDRYAHKVRCDANSVLFSYVIHAQGVRLSFCAVSSLASADQIEKLFRCSICLEEFEENDQIVTLPCFHVYHKECVRKWLFSAISNYANEVLRIDFTYQMGAKHPNMCPGVYVTVEGIIDDLLQQLEEQVPNLSEKRKLKIRRYVCHRVRACLPGEFVEPCSAYFSTSELNEEHVSMMRSLVYYTFIRAIKNYWTMRPRSRNSSASRSTLTSDGSLRRTTNQRDNQSDSEGEV